MNPERWQELDNLFHSALQREPGERAPFLDGACGGDDSLRKQVEALLAAHEAAAGSIDSPASGGLVVLAIQASAVRECKRSEIDLLLFAPGIAEFDLLSGSLFS